MPKTDFVLLQIKVNTAGIVSRSEMILAAGQNDRYAHAMCNPYLEINRLASERKICKQTSTITNSFENASCDRFGRFRHIHAYRREIHRCTSWGEHRLEKTINLIIPDRTRYKNSLAIFLRWSKLRSAPGDY